MEFYEVEFKEDAKEFIEEKTALLYELQETRAKIDKTKFDWEKEYNWYTELINNYRTQVVKSKIKLYGIGK